VYTTHMRTEFDEIIDAIDESFDIARHGNVPLIISHLKCAGAANWGRSAEVLNHVEQHGLTHKFACDCYPYSASSSNLDPGQVTDKNDIFITWTKPHPEQSGKLLADIAGEWGLSLLDAAYKLMPAGAVYHCMSEDDMQRVLRYERTMIGSDGLPEDPHPHPRLWGTFPRVLGRYCRDLKLFDLPAAIHKMSGLSATEFGLKERGFITEGYKADLVLFDPKKVRDMATYENPKQHSEGIEKVWVNGRLSYSSDGTAKGRAGEFIFRA
jgi:N-acyl-D-amino-acid deacylase